MNKKTKEIGAQQPKQQPAEQPEGISRRDFLGSLFKKGSAAIAAVVLATAPGIKGIAEAAAPRGEKDLEDRPYLDGSESTEEEIDQHIIEHFESLKKEHGNAISVLMPDGTYRMYYLDDFKERKAQSSGITKPMVIGAVAAGAAAATGGLLVWRLRSSKQEGDTDFQDSSYHFSSEEAPTTEDLPPEEDLADGFEDEAPAEDEPAPEEEAPAEDEPEPEDADMPPEDSEPTPQQTLLLAAIAENAELQPFAFLVPFFAGRAGYEVGFLFKNFNKLPIFMLSKNNKPVLRVGVCSDGQIFVFDVGYKKYAVTLDEEGGAPVEPAENLSGYLDLIDRAPTSEAVAEGIVAKAKLSFQATHKQLVEKYKALQKEVVPGEAPIAEAPTTEPKDGVPPAGVKLPLGDEKPGTNPPTKPLPPAAPTNEGATLTFDVPAPPPAVEPASAASTSKEKPASEAVRESLGGDYYRSAGKVFYRKTEIEGADAASFKYLGDGYVWDKKQYYLSGKPIAQKDVPKEIQELAESLEFPVHGYVTMENDVYYNGKIIPGADAESLKCLRGDYACDNKRYYFRGKPIVQEDVPKEIQELATGG